MNSDKLEDHDSLQEYEHNSFKSGFEHSQGKYLIIFFHNSITKNLEQMVDYKTKQNKSKRSSLQSKPPKSYSVKKANVGEVSKYQYEEVFQKNENTGRTLRYYICKYGS